jgi:hypothetical protein
MVPGCSTPSILMMCPGGPWRQELVKPPGGHSTTSATLTVRNCRALSFGCFHDTGGEPPMHIFRLHSLGMEVRSWILRRSWSPPSAWTWMLLEQSFRRSRGSCRRRSERSPFWRLSLEEIRSCPRSMTAMRQSSTLRSHLLASVFTMESSATAPATTRDSRHRS